MSSWLIAALAACGGSPAPAPADAPTVEVEAVEPVAAPAEAVSDPAGFAVELGKRVLREVDCAEASVRYVCPLALLPGVPFEPPRELESWLGVTLVVRNSRSLADGTVESESLSRVTFSPEGITVGTLRPSAPSEKLALGRILGDTARAAKGVITLIEVPQGLADYLGIPPEESWPLQREEAGWSFNGAHPARVYKVPAEAGRPEAYVVIEAAQGGAFVTVAPIVAWGGT